MTRGLAARIGSPRPLVGGFVLIGATAGVALASWPQPVPPPAGAPQRGDLPDIVVVTLDATRASNLGLYGYARDTSPHLDAFAAEAVVFEQFIVPLAATLPSHTSMFTGTHPLEHGILANRAAKGRFVRAAELRTLAEWLAEVGYGTGGFVSGASVSRATGIDDGFDAWAGPRGRYRPAEITTRRALAWLDEVPEWPVFLWVHYFDPHYPWEDPAGYEDLYRPDASVSPWLEPGSELAKRSTVRVASYDTEIRYMDDHLEALLRGLEDRDRLAGAAVLIAGDHGEGLGQHHHREHGLVWNEQLRAPLVLRVPGLEPGRVDAPVTAADLVPTLLGRLELPGEEAFLDQVSGVDALASGGRSGVLSMSSDRHTRLGKLAQYSWTGPRWKYVVDSEGTQSLYDLDADPHEERNVAEQFPALTGVFEREVQGRVRDYQARGAALGAGAVEALDPDLAAQLEELGYVD